MAENPTKLGDTTSAPSSQPWLHQHGKEIQAFGAVRYFPLGLSYEARIYACQRLNQIVADTRILYALYKKHHWLMRGPTFYELHLLLDKHADEQLELVDKLAERVQTLGGIALGDDGTNDLLVSDVIRTGELQAWFLAEHLVDTPLIRA
jgi:starvation-inducible DNA-binding protein